MAEDTAQSSESFVIVPTDTKEEDEVKQEEDEEENANQTHTVDRKDTTCSVRNDENIIVPTSPTSPSIQQGIDDFETNVNDKDRAEKKRISNETIVVVSASDSFDEITLPPSLVDSGINPVDVSTDSSRHHGNKKTVQLDTSMTPRAGLTHAVSDASDFEILPDDEEEDGPDEDMDDEEVDVQDDDEDEDDGEDIKISNTMLQRVEEISLEDAENDENLTGNLNSEIEQTKSLDDISLATNKTDLLEKMKNTSNSADNLPISPDTSHHRRRITGFFSSAQKNPLSPKSQQKQSNRKSSVDEDSHSNSPVADETSSSEHEKLKRGQRLTTLIRSTMGAFKDPTSASKSYGGSTTTDDLAGEAVGNTDDQDSSSDESSYDDEEQWLEEEAQMFDDDIDQVVDCSTLSTLPNSFLNLPPDMYDYLDSNLVNNIQNQNVSTFAWEHHLFVKGLLQLLAERDLIGVEDDIYNSDNVSKMGVLRKKNAKSGWHVKYVEVRKGNLTYFADKENEKRKTIHLRKRSCVCRQSAKEWCEDLIFELIVDGGRRILWMAKSKEECQGWIKAINQAMIGDTDDSNVAPLDLTVYQSAIDDFQTVLSSMKEVTTRQEYLIVMNTLLYRHTSSSALRVPMRWIRENIIDGEKQSEESVNEPNERLRYSIRDFWTNLCNTSIVINGFLIEANTTYSGERVIGALSRCILEFDKVENEQNFEQMFSSLKRANQETESFITEVEAVSYARSILMGALQSFSQGGTKRAVEKLFSNDDVVFVKLEYSEPLHIDVSFAGDDFSEEDRRPSEFVGWVETKSKKSKNWKMRYCVLSEGILSYFERADPRPYRLRGQIDLLNAKISQLEGNILLIEAEEQERLLRFEDRGDLVKWNAIIDKDKNKVESMLGIEADFEKSEDMNISFDHDASVKDDSASPTRSSRRRTRSFSDDVIGGKSLKGVRGAGAKLLKNAADGVGRAKVHANRAALEGMKRARHATGAGMKSIKTGAGMFIRGVRGNSSSDFFPVITRRRPTPDMFLTSTRNLAAKTEKREPTVQAVVEMNNLFKVVSKGSADDETKDEDLLIVSVKLYQAFLLSGGPNGRLASGDELLLMEFSKGEDVEDVQNEALELPTSL